MSNKDKYINNIVNDGSHCTIITFNWNNQGNGNIPYWAVISGDIPISSISSNVKNILLIKNCSLYC